MASLEHLQEDIGPAEAKQLVENGEADLIDVREPYEHEAGHIDGARHVQIPELTKAAQEIDPDRPIVFYCRTGARSSMATQAFRASGYQAFNLAGGLVAWTEQGLPIVPEGGTVAPH
jgi:rhodanese-related sulfurtransferase